jgi:hypothetical protein
MSALLLGLLIASAKSSFDAQRGEFTQMSANVILLERLLARYGQRPKKPARCSGAPLYHWIGIGPRTRPDRRGWTPL